MKIQKVYQNFTGLVTQIKSKHASHMVDIGGCSLHHISNAVKNSLPELYNCNEIEDFLQDISTFFSFHVEFCEIFSHPGNFQSGKAPDTSLL